MISYSEAADARTKGHLPRTLKEQAMKRGKQGEKERTSGRAKWEACVQMVVRIKKGEGSKGYFTLVFASVYSLYIQVSQHIIHLAIVISFHPERLTPSESEGAAGSQTEQGSNKEVRPMSYTRTTKS